MILRQVGDHSIRSKVDLQGHYFPACFDECGMAAKNSLGRLMEQSLISLIITNHFSCHTWADRPHRELGRYGGTVLQRARLLATGCNSALSLLTAAHYGPLSVSLSSSLPESTGGNSEFPVTLDCDLTVQLSGKGQLALQRAYILSALVSRLSR